MDLLAYLRELPYLVLDHMAHGASRFEQSIEEHKPPPPPESRIGAYWHQLDGHWDYYGALMYWQRVFFRDQFIVGLDSNYTPIYSGEHDAVCVLGPPGTGKSSVSMFLAVAFAPGPLFCISARPDLLYTAGRLRDRIGTVYHWDAYGRTAPGTTKISFSVIELCRDPINRTQVCKDLAHYIDQSEYAQMLGSQGHPYFAQRVEKVLYSLISLAIALRRHEGWVHGFLSSGDVVGGLQDLETEVETWAANVPTPLANEGYRHYRQLCGTLLGTGPEELGATINSSANAFAIYADPKVVEEAHAHEQFNADKFVLGRPDEAIKLSPMLQTQNGELPYLVGSYDSLFVTNADVESPQAVLLMLMQLEMRRAAKRLTDSLDQAGLPRQMPTTEVHDEGFVSPVPNLQNFLAVQRANGINLIFSLHDLSQGIGRVLPRWGGASPLSLFKTVVVFPHVGDKDTLEQLSVLFGDFDRPHITKTENYSGDDPRGHGITETTEKRMRLTPSQIANGHPEWRDAALIRRQGGQFLWLHQIPYYKGEPWTRILVQSTRLSIGEGSALPLPRLSPEHLAALGLTEDWEQITTLYHTLGRTPSCSDPSKISNPPLVVSSTTPPPSRHRGRRIPSRSPRSGDGSSPG